MQKIITIEIFLEKKKIATKFLLKNIFIKSLSECVTIHVHGMIENDFDDVII